MIESRPGGAQAERRPGVSTVGLVLPPAVIDHITQRVIENIAHREQASSDGWLRGARAIAGYMGMTPQRVHDLVHQGRLKVDRDGRVYLARRADLDAYARGMRRPAAPTNRPTPEEG